MDYYILQDRDGDYVKTVEVHLSETMNSYFTFTNKKDEARLFTYADLWSPLNIHGIGEEFTKGFGGGRAVKIEKS